MRLKISSKVWRPLAYLVVIVGVGVGAWFSRERWLPLLNNDAGAKANVRKRQSSH